MAPATPTHIVLCVLAQLVSAAAQQALVPQFFPRTGPLTDGAESMTLATFADEDDATFYTWTEENDPVMGGQSYGTWSVDGGVGVFQGSVKNVTFLNAPGFCQTMTTSMFLADASAFVDGGVVLSVRTTTPSYPGFKFAFNAVGAPRHHGGHEATGSYKAPFSIASNGEWTDVAIKFSDFSSDWSDYTGSCETQDPDGYQHVCCSDDTPDVCPDADRLAQLSGFSIWAEGAEGDYYLEVKQLAATMSP